MTNTDPDLYSKIGAHGSRLDSQGKEIDEIKADLTMIRLELSTISKTLSEARGGWKTLMLVGGMAGVVGAAVGKLFPFLANIR